MKQLTNFEGFQNTLPYSSELYGIYQPLLGWKSKLITRRFKLDPSIFLTPITQEIALRINPLVKIEHSQDPREFKIDSIGIGSLKKEGSLLINRNIDSLLAKAISEFIIQNDIDINDPAQWKQIVSEDALNEFLKKINSETHWNQLVIDVIGNRNIQPQDAKIIDLLINKESIIAGTLNYLYKQEMFDQLKNLFHVSRPELNISAILEMNKLIDPMESFDPKTDLDRVCLSPIGIIHLFRQYFFEFDSFLGPSVQHIWLSPGSSLELIEINTRKTTIERSTEAFSESIQKTESSSTNQDELSDAIKEENKSDTKFGISLTAGGSGGTKVGEIGYSAHAEATTSYSLENTTQTAKENTHKQLKQQSSKLSNEIKKNFKTTFKTITEVTDTTSKRYVLQNISGELANYELRRKMRQVGVQVQDMGTMLCWQTYVDDPGKELGLAKLVHISHPVDLSNFQPKNLEAPPDVYSQDYFGSFETPDMPDCHFEGPGWLLNPISTASLPRKTGYVADTVGPIQFIGGEAVLGVKVVLHPNDNYVELFIANGHSEERQEMTYKLPVNYKPTIAYITEINGRNAATSKDQLTAEKERLTKEAYFAAAKERIKFASNIQPRKFEELREEERTVVYRNLIRQLFQEVNITTAVPKIRHILAELVQSMFDIDKMLYFVAPEWWTPRMLNSLIPPPATPQDIGIINPDAGITTAESFDFANVISWGGVKEKAHPDNYYITEESTPARLGSSLGWLLQLDGDNLRNAFLNAPWVKAVIPIRPAKELAALNWLTKNSVEGSDGLEGSYAEGQTGEKANMLAYLKASSWDDLDLATRYNSISDSDITIHDAIRYLALRVKEKYYASKIKIPDPIEAGNSYLPTDQVFEHGFDPLVGGFEAKGETPFEVFDQWVEVLPTDQIVAVEVKYDPKTGRQI